MKKKSLFTIGICIGLFIALMGAVNPVLAADCWKKYWAPNKGLADISQWATINNFIWYNKPFYGTEATYEHETKTDVKYWAEGTGYWNSTLPNAYLDDPRGNFFDSEASFTVGTLSAEKIQTNTWYYTSIALRPIIQSSAIVRIAGEKGLHLKGCEYPPLCQNTICFFCRDRCVAAEFTAPARIWWQK